MKSETQTVRDIIPGRMRGKLSAPPSKSISHRLLIIAALSGRKCRVDNVLRSEDLEITLQALSNMGFIIEDMGKTVIFTGKRKIPAQAVQLDFGNSGTSARLLTAVAAYLPGDFILSGSPRMQQRPMKPLLEALISAGTNIEHRNGFLPITIRGGQLRGGEVVIDASYSSQFLSALMLVAPCTEKGFRITPSGEVASAGYVELTAALQRKYGIDIQWQKQNIFIPGSQNYQIDQAVVEGDYSNISYFVVGAAISGGEVQISGLEKNSAQGDRVILQLAKKAGASIHWSKDRVKITAGSLRGIDENMNSCPDLVPSMAVMALFADTPSRFRQVGHLQYKESDRLAAIIENIRRLQGKAYLENDNLIIQPSALAGASLPTYKDHRIAMSFAMAGLLIPGIRIEEPECVQKSFPEFWHYFDQLVTQ
ncbi:MAG: 3-phosphoshikimate 1-carboxyvinyltransferase [Caldithrix sp. RBG_13_44_9]|nr:MAG: 3-phosphoshikimate 1-carboxyvinyltransferase [Caldithrix sp. RBG_13_44_9]